jgi:hypothetical protein
MRHLNIFIQALEFQEANIRYQTSKMGPEQAKKRDRYVNRSIREIIENNRDKEEVERENMGLQTETSTKEEK